MFSSWLVLSPELIILVLAMTLIITGLLVKKSHSWGITLLVLIGLGLALAALWLGPQASFGQAFIVDGMAKILKTVVLAALGLLVLMVKDFEAVWKRPQVEFQTLLLFSGLGMMSLISSQELILMVVSLELTTFPLVLLTAFQPQNRRSAEGGIKYLLMAALGSAVLLFGLSLIMVVTGVTTYLGLAEIINAQVQHPLLVTGLVFVVAGVGFKIAMVPFHMWAPDAYEGAPTPVTAFLSIAGKTAGFALAIRLFAQAFPALQHHWVMALAILSALTMSLGNFAALVQTNIKRLLAYSSIAQAGYMLMGLVAFSQDGLAALLYYLMAYLVTTIAAFSVVIAMERGSGRTDLEAYRGLAERSPRLALLMLLALLSLAGIPPLVGFTAKFYLFTAAFSQGFGWLVLIAVLNSSLSVYYYLKIVRLMYIEPSEDQPAVLLTPHWALSLTMVVAVIGVLLVGIIPNPFIATAKAAVLTLFP